MKLLWTLTFFGLVCGLAFALASKLLKTRLGRAFFTGLCILTAMVVFADVIGGFLGYRSFYTDILNTGFFTNRYAMKVVAVVLALLCYLAVGETLHRIYLSLKDTVLMEEHHHLRTASFLLVGCLVIYWSTMLGFSQKQLFGCDNGPCYCYFEDSNGQVILRDIGLVKDPDPETGHALKPLTPEVAQKYWQQQEQNHKQSQNLLHPVNSQCELWVKKIRVSFDSCIRMDSVVCSFRVTNTGDEYVTVRWQNDTMATDREGVIHYPSCDVGGYWPVHKSGFFGQGKEEPDDYYDTILIPNVHRKFRAVFNGDAASLSEGKFQNLRLHVVYPGLVFNSLSGDGQYLDFRDVPIIYVPPPSPKDTEVVFVQPPQSPPQFSHPNATPAPPDLVGSSNESQNGVTDPHPMTELTKNLAEDLKREAEKDPENIQVLNKLANLYYENDRYEQAILWYAVILRLNPRIVNVNICLAYSYFMTHQYDNALTIVDYSLSKLDPNNIILLFDQGLYRAVGKKDMMGAEESWLKVLSINSDSNEGRGAKVMLKRYNLGKEASSK